MLNTKKSTLLKNFELYQEQKYQENPYKNLLEQIPKGEGLLYNVNGIKTIIKGPFNDLSILYKHLNCQSVQMVPCTVGELNNKAILLMDEEGMYNSKINTQAIYEIGNQVYRNKLYGNIILLRSDDFC